MRDISKVGSHEFDVGGGEKKFSLVSCSGWIIYPLSSFRSFYDRVIELLCKETTPCDSFRICNLIIPYDWRCYDYTIGMKSK